MPLALLVGASLVVVTAAVSAADGPGPGLRFAPGGHWVASPALELVFHINGSAGTVDAQAKVDGIEPGSQVVQSDTSGYVVGQSRIVEFGKSSLSVEGTVTPPTGERPVAVEVAGGPYLVYREAGSVVRLGDSPATIPAGGVLGEPVTTPDGTLWLHRVDSGVICKLARGADRMSCPATAPRGHAGALTVVRERPVFVDTTANTLSPVTDGGLGRPTRIGVDAPPTARVAPADVDGRVAILDPTGQRMYLVDATAVGTDKDSAAPVTVDLPDGAYAAPSASRSSVVLLDRQGNTVRTYSGSGQPLREVQVPPDAGEPRLSRGEDERVYVDGTEGTHVLVVDHGGGVGQVPVAGGGQAATSPTPAAPSTSPAAPPTQASEGPQPPPRSARPPSRETDESTGPPALPASPPGMPPNLRATVQGGNVVVTWGAAAANGAAVSAYRVAWARAAGSGGGSSTRPGGARSYTIAGLARGVAYRITVAAQNSAGRGAPATAQATLPVTRTVTVSRGSTESYGQTCLAPDCGLMRVVLRGFRANTSYQVTPYSDHESYTNPGAARTTDGSGNLTFEAFHYGIVGTRVWVVVDGLESNHYLWVSG
ncbi:hypothetical protein Prum_089900 [Phytohabitans rumicis]|uniref:Fibronectin type-III domain-containing protein n=2 Tax=Phytohabitans rumicis TaxID=1076125 RepID=A0A6V8LKE2_9ACTN|nr:hypothetical protein Prum_089900 [Phytohabitans rumicis]